MLVLQYGRPAIQLVKKVSLTMFALTFIKLQVKSSKYIPEDGESTRIKWKRRYDWNDDDDDDSDDDEDDYRQDRRYGNKQYGFRCYKLDNDDDDDERRPRLYHSRGYRYRKDGDNDDD
ncbi:hypothetical protein ACTXT7_007865 [Hymenolepis weldensis]